MYSATRFCLVLTFMAALILAGCSEVPTESTPDESIGLSGITAKPSSSYGNCLSMPVVFAEGHGLTGEDVNVFTGLRGTPGYELFIDPYDNTTFIDGYPVYRNGTINEWQAEWADGSQSGPVAVEVDWSDNLTRQTWKDKSMVRVEVVLFAGLNEPLKGYNMYSLGGTQLDEVIVSNTTTYQATVGTVYTNVARLKIEKLNEQNGVPVLVVYDSPCYDLYFVDGPSDAYSAEINMSGKCIYGFNWDVRDVDATVKSGWYRLTFSLDPVATYTDEDGVAHSYARNTLLASLNPYDLFGAVPEVVLYQPDLAADGYSTTLEIYITTGGGGK